MNMMRSKILYFLFFIVILSINFSEGNASGKENNFLNSNVILGVVTALIGAAAGVSASYGYKYYKSNGRLVQISGHPGDLNPIDFSPIDVKPSDVKPSDVKPSDVKPSDEEISHWLWKGLNAIPYKYAIGVPLTIAILAYQYNNILTAGSISGDYIVDGVYNAAGAFTAGLHGAKNLASDIYTIGASGASIIGTTASAAAATTSAAASAASTAASAASTAASAASTAADGLYTTKDYFAGVASGAANFTTDSLYKTKDCLADVVSGAANFTTDNFDTIKNVSSDAVSGTVNFLNTTVNNHPDLTKATGFYAVGSGGVKALGLGRQYVLPRVINFGVLTLGAIAYTSRATLGYATSTPSLFGFGAVGAGLLQSWLSAGTTNTMGANFIPTNSTQP